MRLQQTSYSKIELNGESLLPLIEAISSQLNIVRL